MAARSAQAAGWGHWQGMAPRQGLSLGALVRAIHQAWQAATTRHLLAEMDDRMLADIGVSRAEAQLEANRAPWDIAERR